MVTPDYSRDAEIQEYSKLLLQKHYFQDGDVSPQDVFARAATAYSGGDSDLAHRLYDYSSKLWFGYASPVISNAPKMGEVWKALPASCFLTYLEDTRGGIVSNRGETAWLTFMGGGVGSHVSDIRAAGTKSNGPLPFLHVLDAQMLSDRQANVRRGSIAFYMDVSHPDVWEFVASKDPDGSTGDASRKLLNSFPAVNITNKFMEAVDLDLDWNLVCPNSKKVHKTIKARDLWTHIMKYRRRTGVPYLCFIDNANNALPQDYKDKGLTIKGSNLCCVHGDEVVHTLEHGVKTVGELADIGGLCTVRGSSGDWIKTKTPMQLIQEGAEMVRISLVDGSKHVVTLDHRVAAGHIKFGENVQYLKKQAQDLVAGVDGMYVWNGEQFKRMVVESVEPVGKHNSYCWEVDAEDHLWVCNGVLSHNSEIFIPTSSERTAVCVLSSLNLEKWDEWKDHPTFVEDMVTMLDNVVQQFIDNCPPELYKAKRGAIMGRDIGLGVMGLHSLFQKKNLPFGSVGAKALNYQIFKQLRDRVDNQSRKLAVERGAAPDSEEYRNVLRMAIAPTSNNSIIARTSPSVEPWPDNSFIQDTRIGQEMVKNKYLTELLEQKGRNTQEVWRSIIGAEGSVQHLDFLSEEEKDVFKTAFEIDQRWIVELAADRQPFIDQGQSINLFFDANASNKYVGAVHKLAWEKGLKSLYYMRSKALTRPNLTKDVERVALGAVKEKSEVDFGECLSCHG